MPADELKRKRVGPIPIRIESGKIFSPIEVAERIHNFERTPDDTLKSLPGIMPYVPRYPPDTGTGSDTGEFVYPEGAYDVGSFQESDNNKQIHGIFHALLNGGKRDVLLVQHGDTLLVHKGWNRSWRVLVGPTVFNDFNMAHPLTSDGRVRFPTQFEATPTGVIIVPQGDSDPCAYFYDGEVILPLGYRNVPGSPSILGPSSHNSASSRDANSSGYRLDRRVMSTDNTGSKHYHFGHGKIGTITSIPDGNHDDPKELLLGVPHLEPGEWQGAVQWIDYFGNLSPVSTRSATVTLDQKSPKWDGAPPKPLPAESLLYAFHWSTVPLGPKGTIGRLLFRTKDMRHSGTNKLFMMPSAGTGVGGEIALSKFATIPDNTAENFPDNISDFALGAEPKDLLPVPKFKLCRIAFGRLWIGNFSNNSGMIMYSMPGRWGTFEFGSEIIPDATNSQITGMWPVQAGLLVFTEKSTYMITPNDSGEGFRSFPINSQIGCSAPSSLASMSDGSVIWLGRSQFYRYDGQSISPISREIRSSTKRINEGRASAACAAVHRERGEYMCWVAVDESELNNLAFVFDGEGWKTRDGENFQAVCETKDHRRYILGGGLPRGTFVGYEDQVAKAAAAPGEEEKPGMAEVYDMGTDTITFIEDGTIQPDVWILDHEWIDFEIERDLPYIETSWINAANYLRSTPMTVKLWMRATSTQEKLQIDIYRDWRKNKTVDSVEVDLHTKTDAPATWGSSEGKPSLHTKLDTDDTYFSKRRPFWIRKAIYIPSCKVFKLVMRRTDERPVKEGNSSKYQTKERRSPIEFVALMVEESSRSSGMRMNRPKKS